MRRLVAALLGGILLSAPAVTLACEWVCAEPAAQAAQEACHESPIPGVALTGVNACAEHPAAADQGVPLARVALIIPATGTAAVLPGRYGSPLAPGPALDHPVFPPRPPLALRI